MKIIRTRAELRELARELAVRPDWHEPDEQGLTADVFGRTFDNAGFWPLDRSPETIHAGKVFTSDPERSTEMYVVLYQTMGAGVYPQPVAAINLATLFAWACEPSGPPWPAGAKYAKLRAFVEEIAREEV